MNKTDDFTIFQAAAYLSGDDFWTAHGLRFSDGPAGLRMQEDGKTDGFGLHGSAAATCFPAHSALACSWNNSLVRETGKRIGEEAAASGVDILLAPAVNVKRNPLNGRNFEYFSEEPMLCGELGAAYAEGVQSAGVGACLKHFAANNKELGRSVSDSAVDMRTLREIYFEPFERAVKKSNPACVMTAYNRINGVYCNQNEWLLSNVLRGEWGFGGAVISDWGGTFQRSKAVAAGADLEMPACPFSAYEIEGAVKSGELSEQKLFDCVERVEKLCSRKKPENKTCDLNEHVAFAKEAAKECVTLLKNGGALPISPDKRVAVVGEGAENSPVQGGGSSHVKFGEQTKMLDEFKKRLNVIGYSAGYKRGKKTSKKLIKKAVRLAKSSDITICCLALYTGDSEGKDRLDLRLPQSQIDLVKALVSAGVKVVCVLSCGGAVDTSWDEGVDALVYAGLSGQGAPEAVAEILAGNVNPSGRLAESFFGDPDELPSYKDFSADPFSAVYSEGVYVGYRHYTAQNIHAKYPFGFGLGYTSFEFSDARFSEDGVKFKITNTGKREGAEVAQVYVRFPDGANRKGLKLAGYKKVFLAAGESVEAHISFDEYVFRSFDASKNEWTKVRGAYALYLGDSSENFFANGEVVINDGQESVPACDVENLSPAPYEVNKNKRGRIIADITTPFGELTNSRALFIRLLVRAVFKFFRKNDMVHGTLRYAQVRMGAQFGGFTPRQVDGIIDFFNGRYFKAAWKFMTKNKGLKREKQ